MATRNPPADPHGIRALLKAKRSGPAAIASALGLKNPQNVISWYKRGVPPAHLAALAAHLAMQPEELIEMSSEPDVARSLLDHRKPPTTLTRNDLAGRSNKELLRVIRLAIDALERSL